MDVTQEPQLVLERNDIITSVEFGADINEELAYSIKKSLLATDDKVKLSKLIENNPRPGNLPELAVPVMNKEVKPENIHVINKESALSGLHRNVTAALSIMCEIVNDVGKSEGRKLERKDIFEKSSQVVSLLASTHKGLTFSRKMNVKHSLASNIQHLCSREHIDSVKRRTNEELFEEDLGNEVDCAFRRQRIAHKIVPKNYRGRGRGQNRNLPPRSVGKYTKPKSKNRNDSVSRGRGRGRPRTPHF